jgi:hypothetical protein
MMRTALILALVFVSGCAIKTSEVGGPLPSAEGLEVGRSTRAEALATLGPPRLVRRQFDGDLYTWRRTRSRRNSITILPIYVKAFYYSAGKSLRDDLSLFFDRDGILRGMGQRLETEEGG